MMSLKHKNTKYNGLTTCSTYKIAGKTHLNKELLPGQTHLKQ
jgi:hypothetical protein